MLTHITLGYDDLAKAKEFYDYVLEPLGVSCLMDGDMKLYGAPGDGPKFILLTPSDGNPPCVGNGFTLGFLAANNGVVRDVHKRALEKGAKDEGAPGPREFAPNAYGAYFRDTGGNKVCISTTGGE